MLFSIITHMFDDIIIILLKSIHPLLVLCTISIIKTTTQTALIPSCLFGAKIEIECMAKLD